MICGGSFHSTRGTIRSPGSPQYFPNKDCEWTITVPNGQQIEINFKYFDIEAHATCRFDGLEVRNGGNNLAPLLGKFCGDTAPVPFKSLGNQLYFKFYSDSSRSGAGFELEWDGTSAGCGGLVTATKGALTSPNYPLAYPHYAQCEWRISVNEGSSIHIVFSDLDLEVNSECRYDYLEIFDGSDASARSFGKFCDHHPMHIETSSNHAMLRMNTDESHNGRGFHIKYSTNCNRTIEADTGVIESPNFPENYPNNLDCAWTIRVSRGNKIVIQFSHFELENDKIYHDETKEDVCKYDYVTIYDLDYETKEKKPQKSYCNKAPEIRTSTTDAVVVVFHTDQAAVASGFRLEWYNEGCGGKLTHPEGGFTSPNYPKRYEHDYVCTWEILVEFGYNIKLTIHEFDIERSSSCQFDSLTISYDKSFNSSIVTKLCQTLTQPMVISSDGHQLFVRFITDESHSGRGFNITYETIASDCGGVFTATNGIIKTPSYPNKNYENNKTCEWLIRADETHSIQFQLTDFDLEETLNCTKDYLEIIDPIFNQTLWKGCGNDLKNSTIFQTKRNEMLIRLKADETVNAKGFIGNFSINCGGRFVVDDGSGELVYRKASENVICEWTIVAADPSKHVTLTFTYTELFWEIDDGCLLSIQVFEGDNDAIGAKRASFCSTKIPPAIVSHGNALTVRFNSSLFGTSLEFDMHYTVMDNACGGSYTKSLSSQFSSPNYPESSPLNSYCIWTITASEGNKMNLEVTNFDIAPSTNCNENYLEIRKMNANGELIGVFCGNIKPEQIEPAQAYWIKYKTDNISPNNGFLAEYKYSTHSDLQGEKGKIQSPNYPNYFRKEYESTYRITVQQGSVIRLTFKDFHMDEEDPDDCYSNIQIYNGFDNTAVLLHDEICAEPPEPLISETNIIFIQVRNGIHSKTKFQLEWAQIDKNNTESGRNSVCGDEIISINDLNQSINISSPGYPNGYDSNLLCEWTVVSGIPTYHPMIRFIDVDLEDVDECTADYVKVSRSLDDGSWREISKLCMMDIRERKIYQGTPNLKIEFYSDYNRNETGFFGILSLQCGGVLTDSDGVIDFNPANASVMRFIFSDCMWNITVRRGRKIQFEFLEIDIKNSTEGERNSVIIKNGHDESAPYLGIGQYYSKVDIPQTTGNRAFVMYRAAVPFLGSFKLRYQEVQNECGGQLTLSNALQSSIISSPNYPNIPHPHSECIWTIIAPLGREVRIDFLERFDLTRDENCVKEYVELREGSTSAASLVGTFCGSIKPPTIYTKSNVLRVKFFTDISEPKNGFKANVSIGICGGTLRTTGTGYLSSPKYPGLGAYPSNVTCDYRILGPPNTLFSINIKEIDLPSKDDEDDFNSEEIDASVCDLNKDHLKIFSIMPSENSTEQLIEIGTFCGKIPNKNELLSDSNEILIKFKTFPKTNQLFKGFRLFYNASKLSCGGDINANSGYITSIGYPSRTLNKAFCEWRITVRKGRRVKLEFEDLDFVSSNVRTMQRIVVYSDFSYSSRMMFITNNTNPGPIYSSDNKLMLTAWIRTPSQNRGFKIKFSSDEVSSCEGDLNQNEGFIYPANIINATSYSCSYIRENKPIIPNSPNTGTIAMYFTNLAVGRRVMNCRFAATSLTISRESAMSDEKKYLARICGNATEKMTVLSPFPDIRFDVKQSPYFGSVNFSLYYKIHKCGGIVKGGAEPIILNNSPASAANYEVLDCAVQVKYEEGFTISIKIESLNLKLPCDKEFIAIYNGPTAQSPLLIKLCGSEFDSTPMISQKETVYFEYHTDNFVGQSKNSQYSIKVESSTFGCGGILNHMSRRFNTPLYDKPYPSNSECIWELRADVGYQVGLYFPDRFFIEDSTNCTKDYLEFYDFVDNDWKFISRVCGRSPPKPINSTSTKLRVLFHSDSTINADGFLAQWDQNCGGIIQVDEKSRILSSPHYPRPYDANLYCNYTFVTKNSEEFINLKFLDFQVETMQGKCFYDNVTIYKFLDYHSPVQNQKVGTYCGNKNPGNFRYKAKIVMIFVTDRWVEKPGFQLEYSLDKCGGLVTAPTTISSPAVLKNPTKDLWEYVGTLSCVWNITAPANKKIVLKFENIQLSFDEYCSYDYIEVFNGTLDDEKNRLMRVCSNLTIPPISILNNEVVVKMRSEQSKEFVGFSAAVIFQEKCDEIIKLTLEKSSFIIDKSNQQLGNNLECSYHIIGDPLSVIRVKFNELHLSICDPDQHKGECNCDYLEIFDGHGPLSQSIGKFCGHENPVDVISTSSGIFIRLVTDSIRSSTGFKLTVTMQESPCGPAPFYNFTENGNESVILYSPRLPGNSQKYLPNVRCQWIMQADNYRNIEIIFKKFDIEDSENCKNDFLRIVDDSVRDYVTEGLGEGMIYRGKSYQSINPGFYSGVNGPIAPHIYCGSIIPHDYYSQTSKIRIYFESNSVEEFSGFELEVRTINACSRNYTALQGRLMADAQPESCHMTITVPENYTISLYFSKFYFYLDDCEKAFMKVYDGDFENGKLLKILCGYTSPDPIFSSTNQLSIKVQFDDVEAGRFSRGNYDILYVASEKSKGQGCGGEIFNYGGIFTSPLYPSNNRTNYDCIWNVRVPQNLVIAIKFVVFDMGSKMTCDIDYVELMEENSEKEFVSIKKYCGDDEPAIYVSSKSQIRVHYKQTVHFAGTGWIINFIGVHQGASVQDW
ncbi:hypothetical protein PVAND_016262 [Polypedilum vanderplanki]|uniref:CUB domain-containing protein n=1 Tax=Polypedilum vanderplanki TaxID=319348 RepID=A0A9J6BFP2_POLVA|nr:hypothetical protein PVAND_016262 [Polypedilum vanderplanki]